MREIIMMMYSGRLSRPGSNGCCGFFGLLGRVLKVVLPNVLPVSVAGIFRGLLWLASSEDSEDASHRDWRNVRKNHFQNMAKKPEKPTTTKVSCALLCL